MNDQSNRPNRPYSNTNSGKPPVEWKWVKDFEDDIGLLVRVTESQQFRPRYSMEIGKMGHENKLLRHIGVMSEGQGKIRLTHDLGYRISELMKEAQRWIEEKMQANEDRFIEEKANREKAEMDRGKPVQRPGLKRIAKVDPVSEDPTALPKALPSEEVQ